MKYLPTALIVAYGLFVAACCLYLCLQGRCPTPGPLAGWM